MVDTSCVIENTTQHQVIMLKEPKVHMFAPCTALSQWTSVFLPPQLPELPVTLQWLLPTSPWLHTHTHRTERRVCVSGNPVSMTTVYRSVSVTYTQVKH